MHVSSQVAHKALSVLKSPGRVLEGEPSHLHLVGTKVYVGPVGAVGVWKVASYGVAWSPQVILV